MLIEDVSFLDPQANLDRDDELLRQAEAGEAGEALRFWEPPVPFVVLGRTCSAEDDVRLDAAVHDRIPVLRRSSGGGTVLQGPGCLNFAFVLSKDRHPDLQDIRCSYRFILGKVLTGLEDLGVRAAFRPLCDLVLPDTEKKFSGNAQRRGRQFLLHHGTLLYAFDLALISRYLKMPCVAPNYRQGRSHADFVTNLPLTADALKNALTATTA